MQQAVKDATKAFLKDGLAVARAQGIIPRFAGPRSGGRFSGGPWPDWWSCYEIARGPAGAPFVDALRRAHPHRFKQDVAPDAIEPPFRDPRRYATALLRAVIAETVIRRAHYGPNARVTARSPRTAQLIAQLDSLVSAKDQRFACLWNISDVEFEEVHSEDVSGVQLIAHGRTGDQTVSWLMPEALWVGEGFPLPGEKRQGLLFATGNGTSDHWAVSRPLNNRIARLLRALRLGMATTSRERVVWVGEPSMVHVEIPEEHVQPQEFMESRWRRVASLTSHDLPGLRALVEMLGRLEPEEDSNAPLPSVVIAMRRYSRSFRAGAWQDNVLDLATALEACLGPSNKEEIGLTLRTRAAHLLAHDDSPQAEAIYTDIQDLYGLRSDIIHGNTKLRRDLPALWRTRAIEQTLERDRLHVLLDRWRDIVRRAIAARLMLGDTRDGLKPLWPLTGGDAEVDRSLVRRDTRDEWRQRIVDTATAYGLPLLAEAAPPLVDYLRHE